MDLAAAFVEAFAAVLPVALAAVLPAALEEDLPVAALAASSSTAWVSVIVSAVVPSGKEAFTFPCFTYRP